MNQFLFFAMNYNKIYSVSVPNLTMFPYDGRFPSIFFNSNVFFCGGSMQNALLKTTFILDTLKASFIKMRDMRI